MTREETSLVKKRVVALFPALLGFGGIQEAGRLTARALHEIVLRRGWSASFLSLNDAKGPQLLSAGKYEISFHGFGRAKAFFSLAALREARADTRIVLVLHPHLAVPVAGMKLLRPSIKSIVFSHGVEVWTRLPWLRRRALLFSDLALVPSRFTSEKLAEIQNVPQTRIRRLAWPLNPEFASLANRASDLPLPQGFPQGRVILSVGRWLASERYKGADELIQATSLLQSSIPDLHLAIVGGGDDLPRLKQLAAGLGVSNRVSFLQARSREELAGCYARAEVFALPSSGEGFGFVFLEAMAFAKPVVGLACGGITDLIEEGINGLFVPPRDSQGLAKALGQLLHDDSLRAQLGRAGSEIVRQKYCFDAFQGKLERIIEECGLREQNVE